MAALVLQFDTGVVRAQPQALQGLISRSEVVDVDVDLVCLPDLHSNGLTTNKKCRSVSQPVDELPRGVQ